MGILELSAWAQYLKDPLVLVGFVIMLAAGIIITLLKSKIISTLARASSERLIRIVMTGVFIIGIIVVVLGLGLAFWKASEEDNKSTKSITQTTHGSQSPAIVTQGKDASVKVEYGNKTNIEKAKISEERPARKDNESAPETQHVESSSAEMVISIQSGSLRRQCQYYPYRKAQMTKSASGHTG